MPIPSFPSVFRPSLLAFVILITITSPGLAQNNIGRKVDNIINKAMAGESLPGVAVAVIQDGNVLYKNTYGVRSVGNPIKPDDNTVFSIGSVSKAFTAVGLMLLVQDGQIALDDPIKKYLKHLPENWQDITIRQYMTHTSGIPELKGEKDNSSFDQTIAAAASSKMSFRPGAREQYNNFNFAIMGQMITSVTKMDYLSFMEKRVFKPAGMANTGLKPVTSDVSTGHLEKNGKLVAITTHFNPGDYGIPSGGLQTTLTDFIQLSQVLSKGTLLRKKTVNAMWTPYSNTLSNTPGWHSRMAGKEIIIHKGGGGTGIGSVCDYKIVPSRNLYVVVMINKARNKVSPSDLTDDILFQCFGIAKGKGDNAGEGNEK